MSPVHFPSKSEIVSYCQECKTTSNPLLTEQKVIDTVADFFADKYVSDLSEIKKGLEQCMAKLRGKLGLSAHCFKVLQMNLTNVLTACSLRKPAQTKKHLSHKKKAVE